MLNTWVYTFKDKMAKSSDFSKKEHIRNFHYHFESMGVWGLYILIRKLNNLSRIYMCHYLNFSYKARYEVWTTNKEKRDELNLR